MSSHRVYSIYEIDNRKPVMDSAMFRGYLGNPANSTWREWRSLVGVPLKANKLTDYEMFMLCARKMWRQILVDLKMGAVPNVQPAQFRQVVEKWLNDPTHDSDKLQAIALAARAADGRLTAGWKLQSVIRKNARIEMSESTVRRFCIAAGIAYSRQRFYSVDEISAIVLAYGQAKEARRAG